MADPPRRLAGRRLGVLGRVAAVLAVALAGCGQGPSGLPIYPLTDQAFTSLQAVWEPLAPSPETLAAMAAKEFTVYDHAACLAAGLGVELGPGRPWQEHAELAPGFTPGAAGERRSIVYLWQAADPQVIDEESPIRFEAFATLYRPNGHLSPQVFEAHVRTARRISQLSGRPFDFAVLTGDLTDGGQKNELGWVLTALSGGPLDPDSGLDDDPVPGPGNDFNDPFQAVGLGVPWYAVIGNHDALYNGGFDRVTDELRAAAVGEQVYDFPLIPNGFCDGADPDAGLVTEGPTPADPDRFPLRRQEWLGTIEQAPGLPTGHGLRRADVDAGRGYYSVHPLADRPLRLVVLDTVNSEPEGIGQGSAGHCDLEQFAWLEQELAAAHQAAELVEEGNGFLSIYVTNFDHNSPEGSLAHQARELAAAKLAFGPATTGAELAAYWQSDLAAQNLLLRVPLPDALRDHLARFDWPARIESEQSLASLPGP